MVLAALIFAQLNKRLDAKRRLSGIRACPRAPLCALPAKPPPLWTSPLLLAPPRVGSSPRARWPRWDLPRPGRLPPPSPCALPMRYFRCLSMGCGRRERRHARTLQLTFDISASLVVVGAVFLGLCIAGEFPASVDIQKHVGTYSKNIAKYSLYVWTGLVGVTAPLLANAALRHGRSLTPAILTFYLSFLSVLACIGLSIYLFTKGAEQGMEWWM